MVTTNGRFCSMRKRGTSEEGETLIPETFVEVRWEWLAFVATQVGLSIVFVVCIAWHTARLGVDVVKSSNMSELFALRGTMGDGQLPQEAAGINPNIPDNMMVRLRKSGDIWGLGVSGQATVSGQGLPTSSQISLHGR